MDLLVALFLFWKCMIYSLLSPFYDCMNILPKSGTTNCSLMHLFCITQFISFWNLRHSNKWLLFQIIRGWEINIELILHFLFQKILQPGSTIKRSQIHMRQIMTRYLTGNLFALYSYLSCSPTQITSFCYILYSVMSY